MHLHLAPLFAWLPSDLLGVLLLFLLEISLIEAYTVTPRSRRYGDVMATYIREVETPSRVR